MEDNEDDSRREEFKILREDLRMSLVRSLLKIEAAHKIVSVVLEGYLPVS